MSYCGLPPLLCHALCGCTPESLAGGVMPADSSPAGTTLANSRGGSVVAVQADTAAASFFKQNIIPATSLQCTIGG